MVVWVEVGSRGVFVSGLAVLDTRLLLSDLRFRKAQFSRKEVGAALH